MKIKKIEKVVLTGEEANACLRVLNIIDAVSANSIRCGELEEQANEIFNLLSKFIDDVEIDLKK